MAVRLAAARSSTQRRPDQGRPRRRWSRNLSPREVSPRGGRVWHRKSRKGWKQDLLGFNGHVGLDHFWSNPTCIKHQMIWNGWVELDEKQRIALELGAESPKSAMCRQQKCGKQPAFPWHCQLSQYPQTLRPELVHQGPHWIEAFDLSKVEGLTGHPLEATLNEEKEKRKVDKNRTLSYSSVVFSGYVFFDYFLRGSKQWKCNDKQKPPEDPWLLTRPAGSSVLPSNIKGSMFPSTSRYENLKRKP